MPSVIFLSKEIFNTREEATGIWLAVLVVAVAMWPAARKAFLPVLKSLFARAIVTVFLLAFLYTSLGVYIFCKLGFWDISNLKDTVLWMFTAGSVTLFKIGKVKENKKYFRDAVKDNVKFSLILEFIVGLYTFSLWKEILLLPLMVMFGLMLAVAETEKKFDSVKKFLQGILTIFGLFVIVYCVYKTIVGFKDFVTTDNLVDFLLPIILALWFLPFIFFLALYMEYETGIVVMKNAIKSPRLLNYARWQGIIRFNLDKEGFIRWRSQLFRMEINSRQDVVKSIKEIKRLQRIEKNPPAVNRSSGWSPYEAKDFLLPQKIETGPYQPSYENDWFTTSNYIKVTKEFPESTVTYSVSGDREIAKKLQLTLNVQLIADTTEIDALSVMVQYAAALFERATDNEFPIEFVSAIMLAEDMEMSLDNVTVSVKKEDWKNSKIKAYSLTFSITNRNHNLERQKS